jgi:hypothetical protein
MFLAANAAAYAASDPPFPHYPNGFSYTLKVSKNSEPTPSVVTTYAWDVENGRSKYSMNNSKPVGTGNTFELQLRNCAVGNTMYYDVKGVGTDPSQWTCKTGGGFCPVTPFWVYPAEGSAVWNGTDTINGVECDRFEIANPLAKQTFWGTPTAPCRATLYEAQDYVEVEDYTDWVPTPPAAASFDPPAWLSELVAAGKCTPVTEVAPPEPSKPP